MQCVVPPTISISDAACQAMTNCGADIPTNWNQPCVISAQTPYVTGGNNFCGPNATTCMSGSFAPCNVSVQMAPTTVMGGACTASTMVSRPAPMWSGLARGCGGSMMGVGCAGGAVCLPVAEAGFHPGLCIFKSGVNACPNGPFQDLHVLYTGVTDTRDCTPCTCGAPLGAACTAQITVYASNVGCTGNPVATLSIDSANGNCTALANNPQIGARKATVSPPTGGSCGPSTGQPVGTVDGDPATAVTFCCL
jgi:hypothetical protein